MYVYLVDLLITRRFKCLQSFLEKYASNLEVTGHRGMTQIGVNKEVAYSWVIL